MGEGLSVPGAPNLGGEGLAVPIPIPAVASLAGYAFVIRRNGLTLSAPLSKS